MPTISVENYLKTIYHLEQRSDGDRVKNKEIATALDISLPSVTAMLKSLSDEALVDYERYRGVALTPQGRKLALKVIRKHRLIELFLVDTLHYTWDEVHAEAERLEHAISDDLAARIERFLSFPSVDPHGDPIPSADGEIATSLAIPLDQCQPPCVVLMERVLDQSSDLLRYLHSIGLTPGARAHVTQILPFDGQVVLQAEGHTEVTLSHRVSSLLRVLPQPEDH